MYLCSSFSWYVKIENALNVANYHTSLLFVCLVLTRYDNLHKEISEWKKMLCNNIFATISFYFWMKGRFNPIPTSQGRNQPLYERHVTKSGRNRFKSVDLEGHVDASWLKLEKGCAIFLCENCGRISLFISGCIYQSLHAL